MSVLAARLAPLVACAVAFLATASAIRTLLPEPDASELHDKFEYLEGPAGEGITALLVGSSGTFRGFDPRVIDPIVQGVEPDWRSFNLGANGMVGFEQDRVLRRAVASLPNLRWVVVEPQDHTPRVAIPMRRTERERDWHDLDRTAAVLYAAAGYPLSISGRWVPRHLAEFAARLANHGEAERLWRGVTGERTRALEPEALEAARGFAPIEESPTDGWKQRLERLRADPSRYLAAVERLRPDAEGRVPMGELPRTAVRLHRRQRRWLEGRGLEVVYVVPPFTSGGLWGRYLDSLGETPRFVDFMHPDRYPRLYALEARIDAQHVDAGAAAELSAALGRELADILGDGAADAER